MARRVDSRTRRAYLCCLKCVRIFSKTFTKREIEDSQGGALAAPPPAASALKAKSKFAESRRKKRMKKNAKIGFLKKKPCPLRGLKELLGKQT
ncbi:hypothetical protein FJY90_06750 [Candidatus Gottesmanbacteria bacterium]|nr:hypothetical protein [Candidatus Gottesmanbacteria bacterium]